MQFGRHVDGRQRHHAAGGEFLARAGDRRQFKGLLDSRARVETGVHHLIHIAAWAQEVVIDRLVEQPLFAPERIVETGQADPHSSG